MQTDFKITAPVLDMNVIQKAAQDAAMKAALEEVKRLLSRLQFTLQKAVEGIHGEECAFYLSRIA